MLIETRLFLHAIPLLSHHVREALLLHNCDIDELEIQILPWTYHTFISVEMENARFIISSFRDCVLSHLAYRGDFPQSKVGRRWCGAGGKHVCFLVPP
jgi:hypothetical protein